MREDMEVVKYLVGCRVNVVTVMDETAVGEVKVVQCWDMVEQVSSR